MIKKSAFQKVLPERTSNCLALGQGLERGVSFDLWAGVPQGCGHQAPRHVGVLGPLHPSGSWKGFLGLCGFTRACFLFPCGSLPTFSLTSPVSVAVPSLPTLSSVLLMPLALTTPPPPCPLFLMSSASLPCLSVSPCFLLSNWPFPSSSCPHSVPPPQDFPETFSWHCESFHCSLHFDKPQCCGIRMAFLRWLWLGKWVGGVPRRLGLLGPCWAAAGTQKREGGRGQATRMPVLRQGGP